jgi:hypothetical protein
MIFAMHPYFNIFLYFAARRCPSGRTWRFRESKKAKAEEELEDRGGRRRN